MEWLQKQAEKLDFLHGVLSDYRDVRRVYYYEHEPEDVEALTRCARDMRPFSYSFLPAGAAWWLTGRLVSDKKRGIPARLGIGLLRLACAGEVFRGGWLIGNYKQATGCVERLAALQTALGGEITCIIRARDPASPLLKLERPPPVMSEDGSRPRIKNEANRLAQLDRLNQQLVAARRGRNIRTTAEMEEERLSHMVGHSTEMMTVVRQAGGPAAVAATGDMGAMSPATPPSQQQQQLEELVRQVTSTSSSAQAAAEESQLKPASDDVFAMLGMGSSSLGSAAQQQQEEEALSKRERRREKRRRRWWVRGGQSSPSEDSW